MNHDDSTTNQDLNVLIEFARALTGADEPTLTFQTFPEREGSREKPQIIHGTPTECFGLLAAANEAGAAVHVAVNETDLTGRAAENVVALRALFADDDSGTVNASALVPPPSLVVTTSPGKSHFYWLLRDGEPLDAFTPAQRAIAARLGTDPSVTDLCRVLRVPGFLHQKPGKEPTLVTAEIRDATRRYSIPEVLAAMGATLAAEERRAAPASLNMPARDAEFGVNLTHLARAKAYIAKIRSVEGERGNDAAYKAAAALVMDFALDPKDALQVLGEWNETNASPPWSRRELGGFIAHAQEYATHAPGAAYANDRPRITGAADVAGLALTSLDAVEEQEQTFLWDGFIPEGTLSLIEGDPDVGKSFMALDLAARLSTGRALPDGDVEDAEPRRRVLYLTAEDSLAKTVKPRLVGSGADLANISSLAPSRDDLLLPRGLDALWTLIRANGFKLIVMDALNNFLDPRDVNVNQEQEVRQALKPVRDLAEEENVSILGLRHLNKKVNVAAIYRGVGSIAFLAVARAVILVARHPDDPGLRIVIPQKANLVADELKTPVGFRIIEALARDGRVRPRLAWERDIPPISTDELLDKSGRRRPGPAPLVQPQAEKFVREQLAAGPLHRQALLAAARAAGITDKAIDRAAKALGVLPGVDGKERVWALPQSPAKSGEAA